ncbi:MAG TPA: VOC family protein [Opitutaceae bacterium]|jgi:catechol 2,3-dioxygenase-like lactoylglutathione lyase family enzyme
MEPNFIILYVKDPAASAAFYSRLLNRPVLEASPNFAVVNLNPGTTLGLWDAEDVDPKPKFGTGFSTELCFPAESDTEVDNVHASWSGQTDIAQAPVRKEFGYTFVATDPDGHRLRVLHGPAE